MQLSDTAICSRALLKAGLRTIASFDEGTVEAEASKRVYTHTLNRLIDSYNWSFGTSKFWPEYFVEALIAQLAASILENLGRFDELFDNRNIMGNAQDALFMAYRSDVKAWNWSTFRYRVKKTQPSINWDHVHEDFNWLAEDETRRGSLFTTKPKKSSWDWRSCAPGSKTDAVGHASYKHGTCNWKYSLVERPKE